MPWKIANVIRPYQTSNNAGGINLDVNYQVQSSIMVHVKITDSYRRMLRVFSTIGFDLIFTLNTPVLNQDLQDFEDYTDYR